MGAAFFLSGFSSLVYEVVWMRRLALFFGSDVYSAALTLSAFMGGLSLGGLVAARYADRLKRTLVWYGLLEISIGLYALLFPGFLNLFSHQRQVIYRAYFDSAPWRYHILRILIAAVTLVVPTASMRPVARRTASVARIPVSTVTISFTPSAAAVSTTSGRMP